MEIFGSQPRSVKRQFLIGLPVIDQTSGKHMGTLQEVCLSQDRCSVSGIQVMENGWSRKSFFIPFDHLRSIGNHAVMILPILKKDMKIPESSTLIGMQVMREDGFDLGVISDFVINIESGTIEGVELSEGVLDDLMEGRMVLPYNHEAQIYGDVIIVSMTQASDIASNQKGIKNVFLNKIEL